MTTIEKIKAHCEIDEVKGKKFMGATCYIDEVSAQLSSQYNFKGLSTCYLVDGSPSKMYIGGQLSMRFK